MEIIFPVAVTLLTQWIKQHPFFSTQWHVLALVLVLSFVAALVYTYLIAANLWQSFLNILIVAGAIYTYIIARFPSSQGG